jgi:hypothetical protein
MSTDALEQEHKDNGLSAEQLVEKYCTERGVWAKHPFFPVAY